MKELTILIPVLNEEKTIGICIEKAQRFLKDNNVLGEILIADNGSTDNSIKIAEGYNVEIINVAVKGYGSALINGSKHATGKYTIMADGDDSYNFLEIETLLEKLRSGVELVVGNRYKGKIQSGAMKLSHRYIGTPIISFLARRKYKINIGDFNCGLRGYVTKKINDLDCRATGMEYASEMIIKAAQANLIIEEVPINFYKDGRRRKPHLRTVRDGIRHLKIIQKLG